MKYTTIPNTNIKVSKICLGTMTFGQQNTEAEAHNQLNYAIDNGVNFIDTAEMYSIPPKKETQGNSEKYIGTWLKKQQRDQVIVATKITGPSEAMSYIRNNMGFSNSAINNALDQSLKRLQTDYIDLYQLHWPERNANFFGKRNYKHNFNEKWNDNFNEIIYQLDGLVKAGKIRHYGVSNETPWGVMRHLQESENHNLSRCKTIQNPYSLLNRTFEVGLAEIAMREKVGLLAYSPMAFGVLSGKYLNNNMPKGSRLQLFPHYERYNALEASLLTKKYKQLATKLNLSLAQLSLAFVNQQPFLTSTIIGATTMEQLQENINSIYVELTEETLNEIDKIHETQPNPAP